jgi:hypothetical protein
MSRDEAPGAEAPDDPTKAAILRGAESSECPHLWVSCVSVVQLCLFAVFAIMVRDNTAPSDLSEPPRHRTVIASRGSSRYVWKN